MLACVMKITGWIAVASLIILPILWILIFPHLFTLVLVYEALFTLTIGVLQILSSYIYRKNSIPYRWGGRTGWFDSKRFAELKPKERQRYRQEGTITTVIGSIVLTATIIIHFISSTNHAWLFCVRLVFSSCVLLSTLFCLFQIYKQYNE